jgi:hypothetical protein
VVALDGLDAADADADDGPDAVALGGGSSPRPASAPGHERGGEGELG